jgi:hypothetical protein
VAQETPPYVISASSHSAALFRQILQSLIQGAGVVGSTDYAVTQNGGGNLSVNVAPGIIWVPGTQGSTTGMQQNASSQSSVFSALSANFQQQGSYVGYNDASTNLSVASNSSGNPRVDSVCATVNDAFYSGSTNQIILQVVEGTPAASPVAPTIPNNSVVLANLAVANGATQILTANITDYRPFLALGPQIGTPHGSLAAYTRAASATVQPGEMSIVTGASLTMTLPTTPRNGTTNTIIAQGASTTISGSINHYATTGLSSLVIPQGMLIALTYIGGIWYVVDGGFSPGYELGTQQYAPASIQTYALTTSMALLDATNLTLAFIAPPDGNADIHTQISAATGAVADPAVLGILNNSGGGQLGYDNNFIVTGSATLLVCRFHLTGLTAGALQINLAGSSSAVSEVSVYAQGYTGGGNASKVGPALIQAFAA